MSLAYRLAVSALIAGAVAAQTPDSDSSSLADPAVAVRDAILSQAPDRARSLLATSDFRPSVRALLDAAAREPAERIRAMLHVCRTWSDEPEIANSALTAACMAVAAMRGAPRIEGLDTQGAPSEFDLAGTVRSLREIVDSRTASRERVATWRWLLRAADVAKVDNSPIRVQPGTTLFVPAPLGRSMIARWYRHSIDEPALDVLKKVTPEGSVELAANRWEQSIAAPRAGEWLLELTDTELGWSVMRRVIVSDLELTSQIWPDRVLVLAISKTESVPSIEVRMRVQTPGGDVEVRRATTNARGTVSFPLARGERPQRLDAVNGAHIARVRLPATKRFVATRPHVDAHVALDRPLYRRGETIQGRVVLRQHALAGEEQGIESKPLASQRVRIELFDGEHKQSIETTTDELGCATFAAKIPATVPHGNVRTRVIVLDTPIALRSREYRSELLVWNWRSCVVRSFRRPTILTELVGPTRVERGQPIELEARANWAAGGAVPGTRVEVEATLGGYRHVVAATMNDESLIIPLAVDQLPLPDSQQSVRVSAKFVTPGGLTLKDTAAVIIPAKRDTAVEPDEEDEADLEPAEHVSMRVVTEQPRAGQPIEVLLRGPAHERILLAHGRDIFGGSRTLQLDATGTAKATVETTAADWPRVMIIASARTEPRYRWSSGIAASRTVSLARPNGSLELNVEHEERYLPGQNSEWSVVARRDGRPVPNVTVAVAIVDETLFALETDRTRDPRGALFPSRSLPTIKGAQSAQPANPWHVVGHMLSGGAVPEPTEQFDGWNSAIGLGGGAGGAYGGPGGGRAVPTRSDFRATAFWSGNLKTDATGRAPFSFRFPDDLTRWRVTVLAVDTGSDAVRHVTSTATRLPASLTTVLPRVMRAGDDLLVDITARRAEGASKASLLAEATAALKLSQSSQEPFDLDSERPVTRPVGLAALKASSDASVTARLTTADNLGDASKRVLPVLEDAVARHVYASGIVEDSLELALPRDLGKPTESVLTLYGNRGALMRGAADWLGSYPYGCVEQVMSKLMPVIVAARVRRTEGTLLTEAQALRVEVGMKSMRGLLVAPTSGFSWWHGNDASHAMSAVAIWMLAQAKDAGVDPGRYGLRLDFQSEGRQLRAAVERLLEANRLESNYANSNTTGATAELCIAGLRWTPSDERLLAAVNHLLTFEQSLPEGMIARAGIALAVAGDVKGARGAFERLTSERRLTAWDASHPGESRGARIAHRLELAIRVAPGHRDRDRTLSELLGLSRAGRFGATFATSQALHALTVDAEERGLTPDGGPVVVTVTGADGRRTPVTLSSANDWTAELRAGDAVRIEAAKGSAPWAAMRGTIRQKGSDHPGWSTPVQVRRELFAIEVSADGKVERTPIETTVPHRRQVELEVTVSSPRVLDYLVVDCPLPAGFEVVGEPRGWEVQNDRAIVLLPRLQVGEQTLRLRLRAAHLGNVAWPPTRVEAMYATGIDGASRGSRLQVAESRSVPRSLTALLDLPTLTSRMDDLIVKLGQAKTPNVAVREIENARRLFRGLADPAIVEMANELIVRFEGDVDVAQAVDSALPWRDEDEREDLLETVRAGRGRPVDFVELTLNASRYPRDRWTETLKQLVRRGESCGLPLRHRLPLLAEEADALALRALNDQFEAETMHEGIAHCASAQVSVELQARAEHVRLLAQALAQSPEFIDDVSEFGVDELEIPDHGAATGEQHRLADSLRHDVSTMVAERLLTDLSATIEAQGVGFYSSLKSLPLERQAQAFRDLLSRARRLREDSADAIESLLEDTPKNVAKKVVPELVSLLGHEVGDVRSEALDRLPTSVLAELPASTIIRALDGDIDPSVMRRLPEQRARDVALMTLWSGDDSFNRHAIARALGATYLRRQSLSVLRRIGDDTLVRQALRNEEHFTSRDIADEIARQLDGDWRRCLLQELMRRGETVDIPFAPDDALADHYRRILAAATGDRASIRRVLELLDEDRSSRGSTDTETKQLALPVEVRRFMAECTANAMDVSSFVHHSEHLTAASRSRWLSRLDDAGWRELLARGAELPDHVDLGALNVDRRPELLPALVAFATGREDLHLDALDHLLRSKAGLARMRELARTPTWRSAEDRHYLAKRTGEISGETFDWLDSEGVLRRHESRGAAAMMRRIRSGGFRRSLQIDDLDAYWDVLEQRGLDAGFTWLDFERHQTVDEPDLSIRIEVQREGSSHRGIDADGVAARFVTGREISFSVDGRRVRGPQQLTDVVARLMARLGQDAEVQVVCPQGTIEGDVLDVLRALADADVRSASVDDLHTDRRAFRTR